MPSSEVLHKYKHHELHSGSKSGPLVNSRPQAIAIMLSEKRAEAKHGGKYPEKRADGGEISGLVPQRQMGGMTSGLSPGWIERQEARSMMHTGPVLSAVPGRTDRHNISVPSGSYVMPADAVSHLGQNNTMAGMKILGRMFGGAGGLHHGPGPPRPPRSLAGLGSDAGGGKGDHLGEPVEVEVAGGEYIIPPEALMRTLGTTDIKHAHNVMDHWVMSRRKDHVKTLRALPAPAKS